MSPESPSPSGRGEIRIVAVVGTTRPGNYTSKALAITVDELRRSEGVVVDVVDPAALRLAPPGHEPSDDAEALRARVTSATAVLLATPEYHGSFASSLKLLIENLGFPSVLSGKPVALLGVAAGQIGAIKSLEHLRSVCSHVGATVLPSVVSVAGVQRAFAEDGSVADPSVEKRLRGLARSLLDWIHDAVCPKVALEAMARGDEG